MGILKPHKLFMIVALLLPLLLACRGPARADPAGQPLQLYEEKIKAGLVYNFLKYTTWPAGAPAQSGGHLRICLLGDDTSDGYLYPLEGRTAQQFVITITRVASVAETGNCSVVYVHRSQADILPDLFRFLKGKHVLTMSDIDEFAEQGGMVELGQENEQISILVNKKALDSSGLSVQARLLKLAKLVSGRNG